MATRRWPLQLSAVAAGDPSTEADLQRPKTYGHEGVAPICRREKRRRAERHQAERIYGQNAHGTRAAGDNRRAVEKQPDAGKGREIAGAEQNESQERADENRGSKTQEEFAAGTGKQRQIRAMGLVCRRGGGDGHGGEGVDEPGGAPGARRGLARGDGGCGQGRKTHGAAAPAGNGGGFAGALPGFAGG